MIIAGVDEAGRGPLAGPVVAAAVIIGYGRYPDSKKVSPRKREIIYTEIIGKAKAVAISVIPPFLIDILNIRIASLLAMRDAVLALSITPEFVLIDGRDTIPGLKIPQKAIIKGDDSEYCIGAASIIAKVARDRLMCAYNKLHPDYCFNKHKGYPTLNHYRFLQEHGATIIHRFSFRLGIDDSILLREF